MCRDGIEKLVSGLTPLQRLDLILTLMPRDQALRIIDAIETSIKAEMAGDCGGEVADVAC